MATSSEIIIDQISNAVYSGVTNPVLTHNVSSEDCVLLILFGGTSTTPGISVNGVTVPTTSVTNSTSSSAGFAYIVNPPVGALQITTIVTSSTAQITVLSLLGVNKATTQPVFATNTATGNLTTTITPSKANSFVIDFFSDPNLDSGKATLTAEQTQLFNVAVSGVVGGGLSYLISSGGPTTLGWTSLTGAVAEIVVALEPAHAPSMWFPNIDSRIINDVVKVNGLDTTSITVSNIPQTWGYHPTQLWQNSFLHTVGRYPHAVVNQVLGLAAETELETSQIVIDRITQQALSSATSITSDHVVHSQDAVMLIFASQMGVAQALNSVTLNGVALTALGNPSVSTLTAGAYYITNPNVGVNTISASATLPTALELIVITILGVDKKALNPIFVSNSGASGSPSTTITPTAPNTVLIDFIGSLGTSITEDTSQTVYFDQPQVASEAAGSIKLSTIGPQVMQWTTLGAAWVQMVISLEPANALSMWYPAVDVRNLSDVIQANALDDTTNPVGNFYGTYGVHPTQFWDNSFLHTIGRLSQPSAPLVNASISQVAATITFTGGTQTVASIQDVSIAQLAATLTFSGGTQSIATVNDVSIPQSVATLTFNGGIQSVATVNDVSISQSAATLTFNGGTQVINSVQDVSISQTNATLTFNGGTQSIATINDVSITQSAASLTFSGGTQQVITLQSVSITQVATNLSFVGGIAQVATLAGVTFEKIISLALTIPNPLPISLAYSVIPISLSIPTLPISLTIPLNLEMAFELEDTVISLSPNTLDFAMQIPEPITFTLSAR